MGKRVAGFQEKGTKDWVAENADKNRQGTGDSRYSKLSARYS
jgi:hypothetical protein